MTMDDFGAFLFCPKESFGGGGGGGELQHTSVKLKMPHQKNNPEYLELLSIFLLKLFSLGKFIYLLKKNQHTTPRLTHSRSSQNEPTVTSAP
jgi:hypothetical protein